MARAKSVNESVAGREPRALSVEDRFDQLVALAADLAEERLRDKTASNQLISEIIRYGSTKEKLQREKLQRETEMLKAKAEALKSERSYTELVERAMRAMAEYSGKDIEEYEDEGDEEEY